MKFSVICGKYMTQLAADGVIPSVSAPERKWRNLDSPKEMQSEHTVVGNAKDVQIKTEAYSSSTDLMCKSDTSVKCEDWIKHKTHDANDYSQCLKVGMPQCLKVLPPQQVGYHESMMDAPHRNDSPQWSDLGTKSGSGSSNSGSCDNVRAECVSRRDSGFAESPTDEICKTDKTPVPFTKNYLYPVNDGCNPEKSTDSITRFNSTTWSHGSDTMQPNAIEIQPTPPSSTFSLQYPSQLGSQAAVQPWNFSIDSILRSDNRSQSRNSEIAATNTNWDSQLHFIASHSLPSYDRDSAKENSITSSLDSKMDCSTSSVETSRDTSKENATDNGIESYSQRFPPVMEIKYEVLNERCASRLPPVNCQCDNRNEQYGNKEYPCRWVHCTAPAFPTLDHLVTHVNRTHLHADSTSPHVYTCRWMGCPRNGRGFNARYKMLVHVRVHTNEKPHTCCQCGKCFSRLENLKIHLRTHTGERPYPCPVPSCSKSFSNSSDRFKHVRTHQQQKPYPCRVPGCNKRYTDPSSLRKHNKTHGHFQIEERQSPPNALRGDSSRAAETPMVLNDATYGVEASLGFLPSRHLQSSSRASISPNAEIPRVLNDATFGVEASLGFLPSRHPESSSRASISPNAEIPRVFGDASRTVGFPSMDLEISRVPLYPGTPKPKFDISSSFCDGHDNATTNGPSQISITLGACSSPSGKLTHMSSLSKMEESQTMSQWVHALAQDTPLDLSRSTNTAEL